MIDASVKNILVDRFRTEINLCVGRHSAFSTAAYITCQKTFWECQKTKLRKRISKSGTPRSHAMRNLSKRERILCLDTDTVQISKAF